MALAPDYEQLSIHVLPYCVGYVPVSAKLSVAHWTQIWWSTGHDNIKNYLQRGQTHEDAESCVTIWQVETKNIHRSCDENAIRDGFQKEESSLVLKGGRIWTRKCFCYQALKCSRTRVFQDDAANATPGNSWQRWEADNCWKVQCYDYHYEKHGSQECVNPTGYRWLDQVTRHARGRLVKMAAIVKPSTVWAWFPRKAQDSFLPHQVPNQASYDRILEQRRFIDFAMDETIFSSFPGTVQVNFYSPPPEVGVDGGYEEQEATHGMEQ